MNKFQQLIDTLKTDLIILIDDDFTPVTDSQEIVTFICCLNQLDRDLFMLSLAGIENDLIAPLNKLVGGLSELEEITPDDQKFIEAGLISDLLKHKGLDDLKDIADTVIRIIESMESKDAIAELSMMYGLRLKESTLTYNPFFESLSEIGIDKSIRLYRGLIGDEFTKFEEDIRIVNERRRNKFPLLIVDR